jgi:dephospho-CoA kinase
MDIIGLSGSFSSGKDTAAEYLIEKYGFEHHSLSDEIRLVLRERGEDITRDSLRMVGNELRTKQGSGVLAERALKRAKTSKLLISSIRNIEEIRVLRRKALETKGRFIFIWVDAPVEKRYGWAMTRGRIENVKSLTEFIEKENMERSTKAHEQQLSLCEKEADIKIMNNKTKKDLYKELDKVMKGVFGNEKR